MMTTTNYSMKLKYFLPLIVFSGLFLYSCKSTEKTANSGNSGQIQVAAKDNSAVFIDANKQKALGNYTEAIKLFNKALEINPGDGASMYELSRLYTILGNEKTRYFYG